MSFGSRLSIIGSTRPAPGTRPDTSEMWRDTERAPHWSNGIEWRPGRWDPIANAPRSHQRIRIREHNGTVRDNCHFVMHGVVRDGGYHDLAAGSWTFEVIGQQGQVLMYRAVNVPIEWQPMRAQTTVEDFQGNHCQNGGDCCLAGRRDGVVCPEDSCDIDDGIRPKDPPALTGWIDCGECPRINTGCWGKCDKAPR